MAINKNDTPKIYKTDGSVTDVQQAKGKYFSLEELQKIVGGYIEIIYLGQTGLVMVMNEEGKLDGLPINELASEIAQGYIQRYDKIVGDVLVCSQKLID